MYTEVLYVIFYTNTFFKCKGFNHIEYNLMVKDLWNKYNIVNL